MEFLKEFLDEGRARVKSNVFASVALAFVAVNWKVIYFVVFADVTVVEKFAFFDDNTSRATLYGWPLLFGAVLSLVMPFIKNAAHRLVSGPIDSMRSRDDEKAHGRLLKKNEWAALRNSEQKLYEDRLVAQAETDDRINKIEDETVREEVKDKVSEARDVLKAVIADDGDAVDKLDQIDSLSRQEKFLHQLIEKGTYELGEMRAAQKQQKENRISMIGSINGDAEREENAKLNNLQKELAHREIELRSVIRKLSKLESHSEYKL